MEYYRFPSAKRQLSRLSLKNVLLVLITITLTWIVIKFSSSQAEVFEDDADIDSDKEASPIFKAFYKCVRPKLEPFRGRHNDFWFKFAEVTADCDELKEYKALEIMPSMNKDETKYFAYPKKDENLTMITLGIGRDVAAEIGLKRLYRKINFYGADPSSEYNKDLYEKDLKGKYYQYAVSDRNSMGMSAVLGDNGYKDQVTQHISASQFFKNIIQKDRIDVLWIDIEGNEYSVLSQIHRNGPLDTDGVKICQMNVEMHQFPTWWPSGEMKKFHDFVWKVLRDRRYIILKPFFVIYEHFRFIRLFIVNVADKECTDLYLK
ncbi:Methyltransferase FkbM domain-containing protein [Caenorhabditis elegans]|uniref:Methyltransferase FkbM domain-containing protein n=1 Tax=Caenorhabditis elegans TaxID=6239 RepID=Q7YTN9_CAEEL|nr:Methyltransferase FkbM domain-containing protein [Caenorhabditis elegans]CAE17791.1 Methyltransferase FkbM domain-containing protein [Caenorhabditis elegans]|eukprot:NP_001023793.1 Uncharacterized protein CELE_F13A7.12 [Caenorhabditis elegans]